MSRPDAQPDIFPLVHADLDARNERGRQTYGGTLRPFDGRDSLWDAYEEAMDLAVYLRKLHLEEFTRAMRNLGAGFAMAGMAMELDLRAVDFAENILLG